MKSFLKLTTAAAALAGTALFCAPADAAYVGIGVGPVGFDLYSGGYCDRWGCPNDYWSYPIFYGPVYYDNVWYRGPVYYRTVEGERWYWIHGGWHRDMWRGERPGWARITHYGPPLGLDYYREHGFRVRDNDWHAWQDRGYRYRAGYGDYDRGGYYGNEDRYGEDRYGEDRYRDNERGYGYGQDREQDRGYMDRDRDNEGYDRDRGTYEHSGYGEQQSYGRGEENGPDTDRDRGYENNSGYDRDRGYENNAGYDRDRGYENNSAGDHDRGYQNSGYDRDRYEHSGYDRSGGASGSGYSSHRTTHHTSHTTHHHYDMNGSSTRDSDHGYSHTRYNSDQDRMDEDRARSDSDRARPDDQSRDRGSSGPTDQNNDPGRSGSENGNYQHSGYQQPVGEHGHAHPPPVTSHNANQQKPSGNPDEENNGPSD